VDQIAGDGEAQDGEEVVPLRDVEPADDDEDEGQLNGDEEEAEEW